MWRIVVFSKLLFFSTPLFDEQTTFLNGESADSDRNHIVHFFHKCVCIMYIDDIYLFVLISNIELLIVGLFSVILRILHILLDSEHSVSFLYMRIHWHSQSITYIHSR